MFSLDFISEEDFRQHVQNTIQQYGSKLISYDLRKFNSNIVDPIKLIFDKEVYKYDWEDIIKNEIFRQRDKSSNNDIGYFHQRIFQYIRFCSVPSSGWDVVFAPIGGIEVEECGKVQRVYVEMKNKHNTMNAASSGKTYMKMQAQLLNDDDCVCFLVEAIAKRSQNISWEVSIDGRKHKHKRIRRLSMDEFYRIVTGDPQSFYKMCMILPEMIQKVVLESSSLATPNDTVMADLQKNAVEKDGSMALALYMLGFGSYYGFS